MKGKYHTKETKNKMSISRIKYYQKYPGSIKKIKKWRKTFVLPKKDTSIEVKLQNLLKKSKINFSTHQYMKIPHGYQCDILIPKQKGVKKKTVIEAFGTYWHKYPFARKIDITRAKELRNKKFRVLTFWENEIKVMKLNDLRNKIIC